MKEASWVIIASPVVFFGVVLATNQDERVALLSNLLWVLSTPLCLGWAILIRRRFRRLAWACAAVVLLQVVLMLVPAFTQAKTRGITTLKYPLSNQALHRTSERWGSACILRLIGQESVGAIQTKKFYGASCL